MRFYKKPPPGERFRPRQSGSPAAGHFAQRDEPEASRAAIADFYTSVGRI